MNTYMTRVTLTVTDHLTPREVDHLHRQLLEIVHAMRDDHAEAENGGPRGKITVRYLD